VLDSIKAGVPREIEFLHAREEEAYDALLVIGGCTTCCASHCQYYVTGEILRLWDEEQAADTAQKLTELVKHSKDIAVGGLKAATGD
jgi:hypothetical protein